MKVSITLSDRDVRDAISDKVCSMLPEEVLDCGEPDIEITADIVDEDGDVEEVDLSDRSQCSLSVEVEVDTDGETEPGDVDDEEYT